MVYANARAFWVLGIWSIGKSPSKYAGKCHGFVLEFMQATLNYFPARWRDKVRYELILRGNSIAERIIVEWLEAKNSTCIIPCHQCTGKKFISVTGYS